ncbi:conidial pigment biosynthesis scytalone dehydratase Arp1 [Penicillium angulare]|uniref:conidial pigment biosynthesis scytalone dehydratase Arp1 n=1 Tax=Penicillium angulare TaxID=116970 RepID=UPI00253FA679|nr:conidial pigment biosynthesis scytalone dehydratase Arp1 [Penicillium angulare]KAJ5287622.1 conidial pigment biosynthesis scytalone dehydratase Arp1 [Penicillium angulare]
MATALLQCQNTLYDWAESIDTKSWSLLHSLFAPEVSIDYGDVGGIKDLSAAPDSFVEWVSSPERLGNLDITTQHFIGACKWTELSESRWRVHFQIRAAHWRPSNKGEGATLNANGYGLNNMEFELSGGIWKIVLVKVGARWIEGDIQAVFRGD